MCRAGNEASAPLCPALTILLRRSMFKEVACLMACTHGHTGNEKKHLRSEPPNCERLALCVMASGGKWKVSEIDHSPHSGAETKNGGAKLPLPHHQTSLHCA
jgi:hypothetical protein